MNHANASFGLRRHTMRMAAGNTWYQRCARVKAKFRGAIGYGVLLAAGLIFTASGSFAGQPIFQQTYPLAAGGSFLLENVNGSVQVEGWDRNEVEVRAVKL